jgi:predicted kinase
MLIAFSGLPGTGKTSIARELARRLHSTYLRIDTIEQAIVSCGNIDPIMEEGYEAAYRVAAENLRIGQQIVADSVNPLAITREAWAEVAREANVRLVNVEIVCSDETEHRRRVEVRSSDIPDLVLPTWDKVKNREYHPWTQPRIVIDTAGRSVGACVDELMSELAAARNH